MSPSFATQEPSVINGMNDTNGANGTATHCLPTPLEWVHNQYGTASDHMLRPANWTTIYEAPLYTPRKMRVIIIGAGFSGLMVAHMVGPRPSLRNVGTSDNVKHHTI